MSNYFNCKIKFLKMADNGSVYWKTESYLIYSMSFTEAEAKLQANLEESIPEYNLLAMKKDSITSVIYNETSDLFFKAKITFESIDEDSGKSKKATESYLIQSDSVEEATNSIKEKMVGTVVPWELNSVTKTNIVEVFEEEVKI
jgi:hypothetical protein